MANRKLTNNNKLAILSDWKNSVTNQMDVLYFITADINATELQQMAFQNNLLIIISQVDSIVSKITFSTILT